MSEASSPDIFPVPANLAAGAHVDGAAYDRRYRASLEDPDAFRWEEARFIDWITPFTRVNRLANVLKGLGVGKGDVVTIYLPVIPEVTVAMLACVRIGAVHSVVFSGFSAEALANRIEDAGAKVVPLKRQADEARAAGRGGSRRPAFHPLHLRLHRQAQGPGAYHRRLPGPSSGKTKGR